MVYHKGKCWFIFNDIEKSPCSTISDRKQVTKQCIQCDAIPMNKTELTLTINSYRCRYKYIGM